METLEVAAHLASDLRRQGRRVAVIPTVAQMQGLAAMAVHEPTADFDSVVVTMSSAAGHARHAAVTVAESPAMTMAGRCETGDVLGLIEGDFVEIGDSVAEVAWSVDPAPADRRWRAVDPGRRRRRRARTGRRPLAERIRTQSRGIDVEVLDGGQSRYLLLIGLE